LAVARRLNEGVYTEESSKVIVICTSIHMNQLRFINVLVVGEAALGERCAAGD